MIFWRKKIVLKISICDSGRFSQKVPLKCEISFIQVLSDTYSELSFCTRGFVENEKIIQLSKNSIYCLYC